MPRKYTLAELYAQRAIIAQGLRIDPFRHEGLRKNFIIGAMDTSGNTIHPLMDTSGHVQVDIAAPMDRGPLSDPIETTNAPTDNTDAQITVTSGQIWEILRIIGTVKVDATVIARTASLNIYETLPVALTTATISWTSTDLTATASEEIQVWVSHLVRQINDNGTLAIASSGPLPAYVVGDTVIKCEITANKQTADRTSVSVVYRRVA